MGGVDGRLRERTANDFLIQHNVCAKVGRPNMTRRMGCPDHALLLRSCEWDAVSPAERREVATHVAECAACRAALNATDALFAEYAALFAGVQVDSTDTWWASLRSAQHRRAQTRLASASAGMRRWLPATAVVPLLILAWLLAPSTAVLEADALMARALAAEARRRPDRPPSARWRLCSAAPGAAETTADGPPSGLPTEVPTELVAPLRVVLDGQPLALQLGSVAHFAAWRAPLARIAMRSSCTRRRGSSCCVLRGRPGLSAKRP
jgi:hypothetical protein